MSSAINKPCMSGVISCKQIDSTAATDTHNPPSGFNPAGHVISDQEATHPGVISCRQEMTTSQTQAYTMYEITPSGFYQAPAGHVVSDEEAAHAWRDLLQAGISNTARDVE